MRGEINLWRCPDCEWVGISEDGHCRQFDEHPDGPRIPLEPVVYVPKEALDATEEYAKEGWAWLDDALAALGAETVFDIPKPATASAPREPTS